MEGFRWAAKLVYASSFLSDGVWSCLLLLLWLTAGCWLLAAGWPVAAATIKAVVVVMVGPSKGGIQVRIG